MVSNVIGLVQKKGGVGKTTLAAHLSVALAKKGKHVLLVDTDPTQMLGWWWQKRIKQQGVAAIAYVSVAGWKLSQFLADHPKHPDKENIVIIDSPSEPQADIKTVMRAADLLLIPFQPSGFDVELTRHVVSVAKDIHIPYRLVLNRFMAEQNTHNVVTSDLTSMLMRTVVSNRLSYSTTLYEGLTVLEDQTEPPAYVEMLSLGEEVISLLQPAQKEHAVFSGPVSDVRKADPVVL